MPNCSPREPGELRLRQRHRVRLFWWFFHRQFLVNCRSPCAASCRHEPYV